MGHPALGRRPALSRPGPRMSQSRIQRLQRYREARVRRVLTVLVERPRADGWTVGEIASSVGLTTSQLHGIVSHLRQAGWLEPVTRRVSEHHGRWAVLPRVVSAYSITDAGRRALTAPPVPRPVTRGAP